MKKKLNIFSILLTTIALYFSLLIWSNFKEIGYVTFDQNKLKIFTKGSIFPDDPSMQSDVQLLIENKSKLPDVINELNYRGYIIEGSLTALYIVLVLMIFIFLINFYFLVISFQKQKNN